MAEAGSLMRRTYMNDKVIFVDPAQFGLESAGAAPDLVTGLAPACVT